MFTVTKNCIRDILKTGISQQTRRKYSLLWQIVASKNPQAKGKFQAFDIN